MNKRQIKLKKRKQYYTEILPQRQQRHLALVEKKVLFRKELNKLLENITNNDDRISIIRQFKIQHNRKSI